MNEEEKRQWEENFLRACQQGEIQEFKDLWNMPIEWNRCNPERMKWLINTGWWWACYKKHWDMVSHLMDAKEFKDNGFDPPDIHGSKEYAFRVACESGSLQTVKKLIEKAHQEKITKNGQEVDVHAENAEGFRMACKNQHWDVVRWLVWDHGVEKTSRIEELLKAYPQAQEYFRVHEENKEIHQVLLTPSKEKEGIIKNNKKETENESGMEKRAAKKAKKL